MGLRTPLYDWHFRHDGRIVEFGGWDMPVQYSTIVDEHQAVRTGVGLFDISHMGRLEFSGPEALALIQKVTTNNAATMKMGQVRYNLVLNEQGGIQDDVLVYRLPSDWSVVVNASNRLKILGWLEQQRGSLAVQWVDQTSTTCMIAVQGPAAIQLMRGLFPDDPASLAYYYARPSRYRDTDCLISRTGYTGEDGVEVVVPAELGIPLWEELITRGAKPCGLGARDTLRLEAAMPLYGHELTEETTPFQAGLNWAVKMDKGSFVGQEALRKRKDTPGQPVRLGLELEGKRIAREGASVLVGSTTVGQVTSGTFAPTLNRAIAMAYVDPAYAAVGTLVGVDVRGKEAPGRVVPLPFYRRPASRNH
jgi:aminomethyltransferase